MANNKELVTVLTVKTDESQQTIKGLKKEIADLKKQYDSAVIGSEEFEKVSKELATAQANLKTVMADGKKTTDNVEGSYNHLTATMAELKKEWKATADEVKRNDLAQQIDAINTELKDMDASIGNFQRNVGDYTNSFKDAFEQQQKSTENVRIGLDGLQKTASGLASGYAAVQGTLNLLNIESTEFEKAMIKVQSAMAIAQGIGGMKDLIEGGGTLITVFKNATTGVGNFITGLGGVKKAILATGIGIFVVALGTMVAYWDDLTAAVQRWVGVLNQGAEKLNEVNAQQGYLSNTAIQKQRELNREIKIMQANGASELEIAEKRLQLTKETKEAQEKFVKGLEDQYNDAKWYQDNGYFLTDFQKTILEQYPEIIEKGKEFTEQYRQQWLDATTDVEVAIIKANRATTGTTGTTTTSGETFVRPEKQSGVLDGLSNPFGESPDPYDTVRQQMNQWIADRNAGIVAEKEMEMEKIEWMRQNYGDLFAFIQERGGKSAGLVAAGFMESLYTASAIIGAIQDGIDTSTKEGFERNKKLQIANAVIQTLVGVTTALSGAFTTKSGPWDIALAAIQASTIAATGAIQVANIRKQTFNGGNEGDLGSAAATPNINLAESLPIQFTRELLSDTETTNLNQAQKVYVLESDITSTQNKVEVAESNSSF